MIISMGIMGGDVDDDDGDDVLPPPSAPPPLDDAAADADAAASCLKFPEELTVGMLTSTLFGADIILLCVVLPCVLLYFFWHSTTCYPSTQYSIYYPSINNH